MLWLYSFSMLFQLLISKGSLDLWSDIDTLGGNIYLSQTYCMSNIHYFVLGLLGVLAIFSLAMGMERMMRMIVGNYVLSIFCLALSSTIDLILQNIVSLQLANKTNNYISIYNFLSQYKVGIIIVLYLIAMITLFTRWKTNFNTDHLPFPRFVVMIILVLMTTISILFTLAVIVWGIGVLDPFSIISIVSQYIPDSGVLWYISYMPIWMLIHAGLTIFLISDLRGRRVAVEFEE